MSLGNLAPEFCLRVAYPLKDEDHYKHPIAHQPRKGRLMAKVQSMTKRKDEYALQFRYQPSGALSKLSSGETSLQDEEEGECKFVRVKRGA